MHKDQLRVQRALIPSLFDRVYGTDAASERDCTVLNRCFLQGPDPLFLMETCSKEFTTLCEMLRLDEAEGRDAIERAHWEGPGVLLDADKGIGLSACVEDERFETTPWKREALWLILASVSDTTEEDYKQDVTFVERLQRAMGAGIQFAFQIRRIADGYRTPATLALMALTKFDNTTVFTQDARNIPTTDQDIGFYLAYKRGHPAAAVHHGDKTFYGTIPGTTLDEQGIQVDVKVSESYGFVRDLG